MVSASAAGADDRAPHPLLRQADARLFQLKHRQGMRAANQSSFSQFAMRHAGTVRALEATEAGQRSAACVSAKYFAMNNSLQRVRYHCELTPRIGRALEFVRSRYCDPALDLDQVARAVRLSTFHLSRLIKRATGVGFTSHVRALRVGRAQQLLQSGELSVKEVAASVGYTNTNALDRNFKAIVGVTPTVYRRQLPVTLAAAGETWVTAAGFGDEPLPLTRRD